MIVITLVSPDFLICVDVVVIGLGPRVLALCFQSPNLLPQQLVGVLQFIVIRSNVPRIVVEHLVVLLKSRECRILHSNLHYRRIRLQLRCLLQLAYLLLQLSYFILHLVISVDF
jgi:hypothetical protein